MTISELIVSRRKELGLTLEDIGKAVGVGKSTVRKWETGEIKEMRRDKIASLAAVLQIPAQWLIDGYSPAQIQPALAPDERDLLDIYRHLNDKGKEELIGIAAVLLNNADKRKESLSREVG